MKKLIILFTMLCLLFKTQSVFAANDSSFYKAVASFVYNFPKMIKNRNGTLCVYGYDQVAIAIEEKYGGNVAFFKNDRDLDGFSAKNCKLLYVSKNRDKTLNQALATADKAKVVSISLDEHFIENGGTILIQMGRRNFELMMNHSKVKFYEIQFDPIVSNLLID